MEATASSPSCERQPPQVLLPVSVQPPFLQSPPRAFLHHRKFLQERRAATIFVRTGATSRLHTTILHSRNFHLHAAAMAAPASNPPFLHLKPPQLRPQQQLHTHLFQPLLCHRQALPEKEEPCRQPSLPSPSPLHLQKP
ncbi:hypothetical protein DEO72_LG10g1913 [Vigna unguiculata]|uniref:Uncharacterized protein n=1 Tax=Vigna unguiculata TaxID=3917 RepID=A0A4D6NCP9_VIGUN|nr:hypothetical protein DEO72_LG10g1913 [Vigna unguiculata]